LQGLLLAAGPGLPKGRDLGAARAIDLAPTLAHWLGMPAPQGAIGRVLGTAPARPAAAKRPAAKPPSRH
jgi:hypothetical protein